MTEANLQIPTTYVPMDTFQTLSKHDDYQTETSTSHLTMRELLHVTGTNSCDTYLGARMNQKTLHFHTQLHDWSEAQKLSALATRQAQLISSAKSGEVYLPIKKLAEIEYWTKQVNRYYNPNRHSRPKSGSFMKIDVSKFNMKVDKTEERSKSAIYSRRPFSAFSRATTAGQPQRRFFGNDVHSVNNKLIESQMHYSAQRRDIYSATTRKSATSAKLEGLKLEGTENEQNDGKLESDSATLPVSEPTDGANANDLESQGQGHLDTKVMQPQIVSRSYSNRELNVISIDDCKLACRYRPQVIKETPIIPEDFDAMQKARANKAKYENSMAKDTHVKVNEETTEAINGNEADDEAENSEDNTSEIHKSNQASLINLNETGEERRTEQGNVDRNNNETANTCQAENSGENNEKKADMTAKANVVMDGYKGTSDNREPTSNTSNISSLSSDKSERMKHPTQYHGYNESYNEGEDDQNVSQGASKTSYGRITTLYTSSHSSKYLTKEEQQERKKKKKQSRTSRINCAINDMVTERKVMNSLERDFDSRTAQYGRTIIEKTEGSETFKKLHANLRKKMEEFVNTHSAVKTKEFYIRSRTSSARSSVTQNES